MPGIGYDLALRDPVVARDLRPDLILRVGAAPTSSVLLEWMAKSEGMPHVVVDAGAVWKDHQAIATEVIRADAARFLEALAERATAPTSGQGSDQVSARVSARVSGLTSDPAWRESWRRVSHRVESELVGLREGPFFEGALAVEVGRLAGPDEALFVSSSLPVRDVDTFVGARDEPLLVLGNRGASGIDGIVSTAAGVSLGTSRRVIALVGDLAFLHDANGIAALRDPGVRVLVVVVNNDGGGIFHFLPIREHEPAFTPYFVTPQGRDLSHLAALHGIPYKRLSGLDDLGAEFERVRAGGGSAIVEVRTDREENRRRREEVAKAIAAAAAAALRGDDD